MQCDKFLIVRIWGGGGGGGMKGCNSLYKKLKRKYFKFCTPKFATWEVSVLVYIAEKCHKHDVKNLPKGKKVGWCFNSRMAKFNVFSKKK